MFNMKFKEVFEGKKITVMGLGLLGRGVGDAEFLASTGAEVIVTDLKSKEELTKPFNRLKGFENIEFVFDEHRLEDFVGRDYILVSAGVPMDSVYLEHARNVGVPLKQSAAWFAELSKVPIIGVTGTRGKSTVTHMIHHILTEVTGEEVLLGGNVRGVSNLQLLNDVKEDSLCVMELDSWQLQGFGWSKISPQIAVFTNFMEDHLNYYKSGGKTKEEAMKLYFADKANVFKYQEESGVFITIPAVLNEAKSLPGVTLGQEVVLVDASVLPEDALLAMPGDHNRLNASLAYEALKAISLDDESIFSGLASFPGVPGRLEYLGEKDGVKIYNDNNSTIPEATIKGMEAVGNMDDKNIILIAGGAYKDIDPTPLVDKIPDYCKKVILLAGTGTDLIKDKAEAVVAESMKEAVELALTAGESGDVLLFSPGFSSFGMFKNEYERNDEFVKMINLD
jgi:UDP-N-acetylmuramoylalanine--D-glutamate ligase